MIPKHLMESKLITDEQWEEYQRLKHNWNELKKIIDYEILSRTLYSDKKRFADIDEILLKMQELEKGDSNV